MCLKLKYYLYIINKGSVAQMVERSLCMREVKGSMPFSSKHQLSQKQIPILECK